MYSHTVSKYDQGKFIEACLNLGLSVDNKTRIPDIGKAYTIFSRLTESVPDECDVWCGFAVSGGLTENTISMIYSTWATRNKLHQLTGLPLNTLSYSYDSGLYLSFTVELNDQNKLALASLLIKNRMFDEAHELINQVIMVREHMFEAQWMLIVLNFVTERWDDVVKITNFIESHPMFDESVKEKYRIELNTVKGIASSYLGFFNIAETLLVEPVQVINSLHEDIVYVLALLNRGRGDVGEANRLLEKLYTATGKDKYLQVLKNHTVLLPVTESSRIESRGNKWDKDSEPVLSDSELENIREKKNILLNEAEEELERFIGLQPVKDQVHRLQAMIAVQQERKHRGLPFEGKSNHLVFAGPPGTGKTTIARVIAKIYCGLGVMKKEAITEVNRAEIVGQHIGETEHKMNAIIDEALDGVLFIDEAYALVSTGAKNDFGLVAINTLLARMENDRDRLVVIIAGYPDDLNMFMAANEGLRSRFSRIIQFDSYTVNELMEMLILVSSKRGSVFHPDALHEVKLFCELLNETLLTEVKNKGTSKEFEVKRKALDIAGNARFVRNIIERCEEEREDRIGRNITNLPNLSDQDLMTITVADVEKIKPVLLSNLGIM